MAITIRDPETVALVRKPAAARGLTLTAAVRLAVENELARTKAAEGQ